jgi:5'-methylthioadenosine/S-adenosylhomocysteine nucleosidase
MLVTPTQKRPSPGVAIGTAQSPLYLSYRCAVRVAISLPRPRPRSPLASIAVSELIHSNKTAVILTALEVETRAVLRQLGNYTNETVSGTGFFKGQFEGWEVAVAEVGAGNVGAAAIAVRALEHYKPNVALFVGVAGGVKDVAIGDVVVGTKVYGFESGKDTASKFKTRPDVVKTAHDLEQRARVLRQSEEWKTRLNPKIKHEAAAVFVGPIAAGEKVVASKRAATAKLIKEHYSDALAVEMEGRGFLEGVHINHPVQGCVIRGISDLLSGKANADKAGSQQRSADTASAVAFEILSGLGSGATTAPAKSAAKFIETPSTFSPCAYFQKGEVLAKVGVPNVDEVSFSFAGTPEAFLRIIPMRRRDRPVSFASLNEFAGSAELLRLTGFGGLTFVNKYGAVLYAPDGSYRGGPAPMHWATQLFQNGELWSVSDRIMIREHNGRPAWWPMPLIPATVFEQAFYKALHKNVAFAVEHLGLTFPCTVELGLVGLANAYLGINQNEIRGPISPTMRLCAKN